MKDWTNAQWLEYYSTRISREIYRASYDYDDAEYSGYIYGNGHHIRQKLAEYAVKLLKERWIDKA